ncbi:recombinase family protein [Guptibacillus algicola]|uniref:recombinase family protein n=1 Tax=Guptibacillus algicola TaxID=225844 RepID=UPI001CD7DCC1|nr:recombinase family protein [Alkalihalobacillus algicola]MCA0986508.1 recombinase family protein [Alkalihalobacillus algicola]
MPNGDSNHRKAIAFYCRVSTDEQAYEGISLDEQQERLTSYCKAMGWKEPIRLFIDKGVSAKNANRPELNKLLAAIAENKICKVLVTKLDRLSRKLLDLLSIIELFLDHDVDLVSLSETFDTCTPSGRLTMQVLGAVAEFERESVRERVYETMNYAAQKGEWMSQSPYGYRLIEKKLVIYEQEAKIVREIYDYYLNQGLGYQAIAKQLNHDEIPSKKNRGWSAQSIKLILSNPVYKGTTVWNRTQTERDKRVINDEEQWITHDHAHEAIIDEKNWNAVQERMKQRHIPSRAKTSPHLLSGLLKCGHCGGSMVIGWSGSKNHRYRVYKCSTYKNKGMCIKKQYRANHVEEWFVEGLTSLFLSFNLKFDTEVFLNVDYNKASLEQKMRSSKKRYERKVEAFTEGLISLKELQDEKTNMDDIQSRFKEETTLIDMLEEGAYKEAVRDYMKLWKLDGLSTNSTTTKSIFHNYVDKVYLYSEKNLLIYFF